MTTDKTGLKFMKHASFLLSALAGLLVSSAVIAKAPAKVEFLNSGKVLPTTLPFSEAVRVGDMLYLSGQIGIEPGTLKLVPGGIKEETKQAMSNIKTTLGMEMLTCQTPVRVIKEIWVYLLAYNLIRLMMAQAALLADCLPRQLSFKHAVQLCIAWTHESHGTTRGNALAELLALIGQQRVGDRPGRIEPRALKRRPKGYDLLTMPRDLARARVRRFGHPKNVK